MRTTVTLDPDVVRMLRKAMHRSRQSFKEALNSAIRDGLRGKTVKSAPFVIQAKPMELKPGIDPASLNKLADELEVDAFFKKAGDKKRR